MLYARLLLLLVAAGVAHGFVRPTRQPRAALALGAKRALTDAAPSELEGKRILVRVDLNDDGEVSRKVAAIKPTVEALTAANAKVLLISHSGRPKSVGFEEEYSMKSVVGMVEEVLGQPCPLAPDCVGDAVDALVDKMAPGEVLLLENVRFHAGETADEEAFAKSLAAVADVFVQDAFGTAHRSHASTNRVPKMLSPSLAGVLMGEELRWLRDDLPSAARPLVGVVGGASVKSKRKLLSAMIDLHGVDEVVVGGGVALPLLKAKGLLADGASEDAFAAGELDLARAFLNDATAAGVKVTLPVDLIEAAGAPAVAAGAYASAACGDVGPDTATLFEARLATAGTAVWNGPMGRYEEEGLEAGTYGLARALGRLTQESGVATIVAGADSATAVSRAGGPAPSFVSTGGGAAVACLSGEVLAGAESLDDADEEVAAEERV